MSSVSKARQKLFKQGQNDSFKKIIFPVEEPVATPKAPAAKRVTPKKPQQQPVASTTFYGSKGVHSKTATVSVEKLPERDNLKKRDRQQPSTSSAAVTVAADVHIPGK